LKNITTLKALGDKFADACGWTYIDTFETVVKEIQNTKKDSIIVIYSAGDIDYKLRNFLEK
jgi:UDP-N-acetylmuramate-alanine ligase